MKYERTKVTFGTRHNCIDVPENTPYQYFIISVWKRNCKSGTIIENYTYTGCPKKNDPTLQCHIFKNIEFDFFKFSTVI